MLTFRRAWIAIAAVLIAAMATAARADLRADIRTTYDFSKMTIMGRPISPIELIMIQRMPMFKDGGIDMSLYASGSKVKVEMPVMTTIVDLKAKTSTMIMSATKQYSVTPLSESQTQQIVGNAETNVRDMHQSKTIHGHMCHLYRVYAHSDKMTMLGFLWAADDLPTIANGFPDANVGALTGKVKGFPMRMDATMSMPSLFGTLGFSYDVGDISTDPLDPSIFTVPPGYTEQQAAIPPGQT
jgi:hypothetical protein